LRGPDRAELALCMLFMLPFLTFFALDTWHGGAGNNMRYFLHFVPVLAILSAVALREIAEVPGRRPGVAAAGQVALLVVVFAYVAWRGFSFGFAFENTLPIAIFLAISVLAAAFLVAPAHLRATAASALYGLAMLGLVTAFLSAWLFDLQVSQRERRLNSDMQVLADRLPADALVVTFITSYAGYRLNQPPAMTAKAEYATREFDVGLVAHAFAVGRPVYAQSLRLAEAMVETGAASAAEPSFGIDESKEFYRMAPPAGLPAAGQ
jgi:hypothetical protein